MRRNEKRRGSLRAAAICLGALVGVSSSCVPAFASSPEFARTPEEWASLRDNRMDYAEIEDLVHEYNPTVQQNQYDYLQFREDYGTSKTDVSDEYRRLAVELRDDIYYPDADDAAYAMMMTAALTAETQAKNLERLADDNLEDAEIKRLSYEMAEKTLTQTAQSSFVGYYTGLLDIENAEKARDLASLSLTTAQAQAAVGMGTQIAVLNATQSLQSAEKNILSARSSQTTLQQKLQVMLGWKVDSVPEIGPLPAADPARIDAMDPANDCAAALENNYQLRIYKKELQNANSDSQRDTLNSQIADAEQKIRSSLVSTYQSAVNARNAWTTAVTAAQLSQRTLAETAQKYQVGVASRIDYESAVITARQAEIAAQQAEYAMFLAMENYDWAVRGLAAAS